MVSLNGIVLQPDNIVVARSLEYLVEEVLSQCKPVWAKDRVELTSSSSNVAEGTDDDEENWATTEENEPCANKWEFQVQAERTFICYVAVPCHRSTVTVSSTDAHCPNIKNPRLCVNMLNED